MLRRSKAIVHAMIPFAERRKPRVVVLGSGWGSFAAMTRLSPSHFDVICVSPRNHMLFTPLLASSAVGTLDFRSITEPIEETLPSVVHLRAHAISMDATTNTIICEVEEDNPLSRIKTFPVSFDFAVIGVGARPATFGVPGVEQHAHFLKELTDARVIRLRILRNLAAAVLPSATLEERAALLSFVIVGGGPTGIEFAAELFDFLSKDVLRLHPELIEMIKITVLEAGGSVLSSFEAGLREYATNTLRHKRIDVRTNAKVVRVEASSVVLADNTVIPCGLCVWNTGLQSTSLIRAMTSNFSKDKWGHLVVTPNLRVLGTTTTTTSAGAGADMMAATVPFNRIFALGDAVMIGGGGESPLPPTAQVAEQQGFYLAEALNSSAAIVARASGATTGGVDSTALAIATAQTNALPFKYSHSGNLFSLGMSGGASDFSQRALPNPHHLDPLKGTTFTGAAANAIWKGAYMTKLGSWKNRLQVPLDWLKAFLYGRDTTIF